MTPIQLHDEWLQSVTMLFHSEDVEIRVRGKAAKLARNVERYRRAGAQIPVLEVDDFVQYAWLIMLKGRPEFPDALAMRHYFFRRMENYFKDQCVKPEKAKIRCVSMDDAETHEADGSQAASIVSLENYRGDEAQRRRDDVLRDFRAFLALHDAELLPLLSLFLDAEIVTARDQAERLQLPVQDIYTLRVRLKTQATRFAQQTTKTV